MSLLFIVMVVIMTDIIKNFIVYIKSSGKSLHIPRVSKGGKLGAFTL
jgi:hypothetical protein